MADENDININIGANPAGVEAGTRRAKTAVKGVTDESKALDAAFRRLKSSIDPTFAATERYNKTLADNKRLLDAGRISQEMYARGAEAAYTALQKETAAIQSNSAAARAAAAEIKAAKAQQTADAKAAAQASVQAARETAAAERQAAREAAAVAKQAKAEEKAAIREAATAAKLAAREKAAAEKAAQREIAQAAKDAANSAKADARAKSQAERQASREAAEAEKQAKREMKQAAREAAQVAAQAARDRKTAERQAAQAAREAAKETVNLAKAERMAASAADDLRASINPVFAAQQRYNQTMQRATQLLMQNKLRTGEWVAIQKMAKAQMDLNVRSLGRQNAMYVQLGYQAQDVTASLASGINPLVILAQQGGQTAAAMSTMGGTIGRVASFLAGPWGAAIIGFTLLVGYLTQANDDAKKKTLDLNDAEGRRIATVKELTAAIRDQLAAQREQNNQNLINLRNANNLNYTDQLRLQREVTKAQEELNVAQAEYNRLRAQPMSTSKGGMEAQAGQMAMAAARLSSAQQGVANAQKSLQVVTDSLTESRTRLAQAQAEATLEDAKHQTNLQTLTDTYRKSGQSVADYNKYLTEMRLENERYTVAKAKETEARRANEKAAKDEAKAIFQTREAAIGVAGKELRGAGYGVTENNQFGGVKGNHPGMGNAAHGKFAIDVNIPGVGEEAFNPVAKRRMDEMVKAYQARGFRVLWNGKVYEPHGGGASYDIKAGSNQHTNHAHVEAPQSIIGKAAGSKLANQLINDAERVESESERLQREITQDMVAEMEFRKELAGEDLAQVLQIQDEKIAAIKDFYGAESKEAQDAAREKIRIERSKQQQDIQIARETIDKKLQLAQMELDAQMQAQETQRAMAADVIDYSQGGGLISDDQAIVEKARLLDAEFQQQATHEQRMYQLKANAIRDALALENLTLEARRQLNSQLEILEAEHLGRVQALQGNHARAVQAVELQASNLTLQKWRDVAQSMTQSLGSAFQGLWTRSITVQQALINMADTMVYKLADIGLKALEDFVIQQGIKLGIIQAHQAAETGVVAAGETTRTGVKAGAEAARTGIGAAAVGIHGVQEGVKTGASVAAQAVQTGAKVAGEGTRGAVGAAGAITEIGTRAATSAAGAYSSTVVIPFIGPVAAPAAAALALAAVLGFGALISARGGQGEVGTDGQLTQLHKKEMVLPAWIAEPLRAGIVSARGNSSPLFGRTAAAGAAARTEMNSSQSNVNFHYKPSHTNMGASFETLLRADGRNLRKWIKNEIRNGSLSLK